MAGPVIVIEHLSRNFGPLKAVSDVSLKVDAGEIYALIGPNGAGKTTLVKMLVGLLAPASGHAAIAGHDIMADPLGAKKEFGYLPDNPAAYDFLTGSEFLHLTGALNGLPAPDITRRVHQLSAVFPISQILAQRMGSYSRGNRQKVAFLASLMASHRALIIDEPVVGLDPSSITIFGDNLTQFAQGGGAVLLVTHTLSFAQKYATHVGVMHQGRIVTEKAVAGGDLEQLYLDQTSEK